MYGLFIDDSSEPYLTTASLANANEMRKLNRLPGNGGHHVTVMVADPECVCGEEMPGWFEVDLHGDLIDPACHDRCRSDVAAMARADAWF